MLLDPWFSLCNLSSRCTTTTLKRGIGENDKNKMLVIAASLKNKGVQQLMLSPHRRTLQLYNHKKTSLLRECTGEKDDISSTTQTPYRSCHWCGFVWGEDGFKKLPSCFAPKPVDPFLRARNALAKNVLFLFLYLPFSAHICKLTDGERKHTTLGQSGGRNVTKYPARGLCKKTKICYAGKW